MPPWTDASDLPLPAHPYAAAIRDDVAVFAFPGATDKRRGTLVRGGELFVYGAKRGGQCAGRWLSVGPFAWVCSDAMTWDAVGARAKTPTASELLPYRYYFARHEGAFAYESLERAIEGDIARELEAGFAVAGIGEREYEGERWVQTKAGHWIAARELMPARPSTFRGKEIAPGQALSFAWVVLDKANVLSQAKQGRVVTKRARFETVPWREEAKSPQGNMVRTSEDEATAEWMRARDLAHPTLVPPPDEVTGSEERWIDVDLASQTLVAYEGARPVFATLVSTGRDPAWKPGQPREPKDLPPLETRTPTGTFRIWVKLWTSTMDNIEDDEAEHHYSMEDVPFVQFFSKGIALHGAFWHNDFGRPRSHGCVNLAPADAAWLFAWTAPHLPRAWTAALPSPVERGTVVRVR